jgi:glycosyltransferase involved in cell wall biosynthesis
MQVDESKIIETSYGLDKADLITVDAISFDREKISFTALFVGSVIPRKGIHLLLDYWKTAGVDGKLKVIGKIEPESESIVDAYRNDASIEFVSFTNDLASHYKNADVFIMPSLEEGSPLVTYLAIGAGLPCLVSPMAGDGVIRNNIDGYLFPAHDKNAWVAAIQKLAKDKSLRTQFALSSRERAENFLWPKVAQRRAAELLNKLGKD